MFHAALIFAKDFENMCDMCYWVVVLSIGWNLPSSEWINHFIFLSIVLSNWTKITSIDNFFFTKYKVLCKFVLHFFNRIKYITELKKIQSQLRSLNHFRPWPTVNSSAAFPYLSSNSLKNNWINDSVFCIIHPSTSPEKVKSNTTRYFFS